MPSLCVGWPCWGGSQPIYPAFLRTPRAASRARSLPSAAVMRDWSISSMASSGRCRSSRSSGSKWLRASFTTPPIQRALRSCWVLAFGTPSWAAVSKPISSSHRDTSEGASVALSRALRKTISQKRALSAGLSKAWDDHAYAAVWYRRTKSAKACRLPAAVARNKAVSVVNGLAKAVATNGSDRSSMCLSLRAVGDHPFSLPVWPVLAEGWDPVGPQIPGVLCARRVERLLKCSESEGND